MNVIGHFANHGSLAKVARDNTQILKQVLGIEAFNFISFPHDIRTKDLTFERTYVHVNPHPNNMNRFNKEGFKPSGETWVYWCGETSHLTPSWGDAVNQWKPNQVFTLSKFFKDILDDELDVDSKIVHHLVETRDWTPPEDKPFTFLVSYDARSRIARKNPEAAIRAFKAAFHRHEKVRLVVKTSGASPDEHRYLLGLLQDRREQVELINSYWHQRKFDDFFFSANCYVSPHRAEGFGLHMAEAMGAGMPTIATGYSGNLDFMTPENSWLLDYDLIDVEDDFFPAAAAKWADVKHEHLVECMREVYNGGNVDNRTKLGKQTIKELCSLSTLTKCFSEHLNNTTK